MTFEAIILGTAKAVGVPGALLLAICTHESGLKNVLVQNDNGTPSYGICQIKEGTAQTLGFKREAKYLMNPKINAAYAALYLKQQLDRYDGDWCKATSAYNAGTYNPSTRSPGKPRNFKYIKRVILHLDNEHKDFLICGERKREELK